MNLKLIIWNVRGWKDKRVEIIKLLEDCDIGIITDKGKI